MREIEFDQLWSKLDKEVQVIQRKEEDNIKMEEKKVNEQQLADDKLCRAVGGLHLGGKFAKRLARQASKRDSSSATFDVAVGPDDSSSTSETPKAKIRNTGVPGISGDAFDLMSDMDAPSRSKLLADQPKRNKKKKTTRSSSVRPSRNARSPNLDAKKAMYKSLQSPDFGYAPTPRRTQSLVEEGDRRKSKRYKELTRVSILSSKTALSW